MSLPPMRQKPNGIWVADIYDDDGNRRRVSCGTRDKAQARARARELALGIDIPPPPSADIRATPSAASGVSMAELFRKCCLSIWTPAQYQSQANLHSDLKSLEAIELDLNGTATPLGAMAIIDLTAARLYDLVTAFEAQGLAPGTIKGKLQVVGRALKHAAHPLGIISAAPPTPKIKVNNKRERVLDENEETAAFAAIDARIMAQPARQWTAFKHLFRFLLDTGCRLNEVLKARLEWIVEVPDSSGRPRAVYQIPGKVQREVWAKAGGTTTRVTRTVNFTKTGLGRLVPLSEAVVETMIYLRVTSPDGSMFRLTPSGAWYMMDTIRKDLAARPAKAGGPLDLSNVVLHTLRHTCLTRLARRGMRIEKLAMWAGHADIKVTRDRYAHFIPTDILEALDALAEPAPTRARHLVAI